MQFGLPRALAYRIIFDNLLFYFNWLWRRAPSLNTCPRPPNWFVTPLGVCGADAGDESWWEWTKQSETHLCSRDVWVTELYSVTVVSRQRACVSEPPSSTLWQQVNTETYYRRLASRWPFLWIYFAVACLALSYPAHTVVCDIRQLHGFVSSNKTAV